VAVSARDRRRRELEELIDALDRRVPQVLRVGEAAIAEEAAALRAKAVERLTELTRAPVARPSARGDAPGARSK
jgi:hypothetical protein